MSRQELMVECISRNGFSDLYVGYADGACQTFYTLEELTEWFVSKGVPDDDELWHQLQHLQDT